jgi:site-specific recombinase XerD
MDKHTITHDPDAPGLPTWDDCLERFRQFQVAEERSGHTIRAYAADLGVFRDWFEKDNGDPPEMDQVNAIQIRAWKDAMLSDGRAAATINRRLATLGSFLRWAVDEGLIPRQVKPVKAIKQEKLGHRGLEVKEERNLLSKVEADDRHRAVVHMLLYTGMRVDELAHLKWRDIKLSDRKGTLTVTYGKGGKTRLIPVNVAVRAALELLGLAEYRGRDRHVVYGKRGPLKVRAIQAIVEKYGISAHMLRHTYAHKFLKIRGNTIVQLATILGHESLDTTKRYTTPSADDLQEAVDRMNPS